MDERIAPWFIVAICIIVVYPLFTALTDLAVGNGNS
jgi:hypothetical protein